MTINPITAKSRVRFSIFYPLRLRRGLTVHVIAVLLLMPIVLADDCTTPVCIDRFVQDALLEKDVTGIPVLFRLRNIRVDGQGNEMPQAICK